MLSNHVNVLLLTTYELSTTEHVRWNTEIYDALLSRGAVVSYASFLSPSLTIETLCTYTHVLFLTCCHYVDYISEFNAFISERLVVAKQQCSEMKILNDPRIILWNSNKTYLSDLLAAEFSVPPTIFVDRSLTLPNLKAALANKSPEIPVVIKPSISASGVGTLLIQTPHNLSPENESSLAKVIPTQPPNSQLMIQPFLPSISKGELSLVYINQKFQHAVLKCPAEGEFRVNKAYGATFEAVPEERIPRAALKVAEEVCGFVKMRFGLKEELSYVRVNGVVSNEESRDFILMEVELIEPSLGFGFGEGGERVLGALYDLIITP